MFRAIGAAAAFLPVVLGSPATAQQPGPARVGNSIAKAADFDRVVRNLGRNRPERDNRNFHLGPTGTTAGDERLFGGFQSRAMALGLGLFRVPRINHSDPNRNSPMQDMTGRTQRVAAVGMSVRF